MLIYLIYTYVFNIQKVTKLFNILSQVSSSASHKVLGRMRSGLGVTNLFLKSILRNCQVDSMHTGLSFASDSFLLR